MTEDVLDVFDKALGRALAAWEMERQSVALGTKLLRQFRIIRRAFVQIALDIREDSRKRCKSLIGVVVRSRQSH